MVCEYADLLLSSISWRRQRGDARRHSLRLRLNWEIGHRPATGTYAAAYDLEGIPQRRPGRPERSR
jgi:hypothetical protein